MSDEDFEPFAGGPPPDPSERTWRHPSEIAAQAQAAALADFGSADRNRGILAAWRPTSTTNVLIAGSLGAAACLTALALFQLSASAPAPPTEVAGAAISTTFGARSPASPAVQTPAAVPAPEIEPAPSTVPVSLPAPLSPAVEANANEHLVGITTGAGLTADGVIASGVLVDGYLMTSASAVGNQLSVSYTHRDRRALAYLIGIDPFSDLAVFRPSAESRAGRTLESLSINVGDPAAVGDQAREWAEGTTADRVVSPGDEVTSATLTSDGIQSSTGMVLATERSSITPDGQPLIGLIDTSIRRPDQLGSALIDTSGAVVGIIVDASSSLASAIPIGDAVTIADRLTQQGWANETWIGFVGMDRDEGVEVIDVTTDGPAADADLRPGDVIRYLDGARIDDMGGITAGLRRAAPGDLIVIVVERSGELIALRIEVSAYEPDAVGHGESELVDAGVDRREGIDGSGAEALSESADG